MNTPRFTIHPMNEPKGEGNGWHDCPDDLATNFFIFDELEPFGAIEDCKTREDAERKIREYST